MYRWYWKAVYHDGTGVSQLETNPATGREWSSESVDFDNLTALVLEPIDSSPRVIVQARQGEVPRRLWRHYVDAAGPRAGKQATCWGLNIFNGIDKACLWLKPDNLVVLSFDFQSGSDYCFPENATPEELEASGVVALSASETGSLRAVSVSRGDEVARRCDVQAGTQTYPGMLLSTEQSVFYTFFRPADKTIVFTTDAANGPMFDVPRKK